ncbi:hypothetical protein [Microtetraspora niveoalba]|uniref:hypothetical protein n=1 Tax=Microtetraspora niveoalba TaxID=46175 RepID=UPI0008377B8C|nr:hypothetical protein [Microtetraspora niveoalba]
MDDGGSVAGHRLTGRTRSGEVGTWSEAVSPAGTPSGVLRFAPALVATPAARERLVAAVTADRRLIAQWGPAPGGRAGLLPVADLVTARGDIWLVAGGAPVPVLADLLADVFGRGGPSPGPGAVASILAETAQTLLVLHAAGLAHGAVHPGTVVIAGDGSALLAERGLLEALRGEPASPERDVAAWVQLARGLAASWADDGSAVLFDRAASAASAHGLAAARDTLLAAGPVPEEYAGRASLLGTLRVWSTTSPAPVSPVPASPAPVSPVPASPAPVSPAPASPAPVSPAPASPTPVAAASAASSAAPPDEAVTLLHLPGPADQPAQAAPHADTAGAAGGDDVVMRFGPGVPADTTAAQIWRSGTTTQFAGEAGGDARPVRRGRRTRRGAWAGSALLAALLAVVILWLRFQPAADVLVQKVDVRGPKKTISCDGTASLVGTVTTNGGAGRIRYVWVRSDGVRMPEREQNVLAGDTSVELPLRWEVTGSGRFKGVATLRVLSPTSSGEPLQDKASFSYRC